MKSNLANRPSLASHPGPAPVLKGGRAGEETSGEIKGAVGRGGDAGLRGEGMRGWSMGWGGLRFSTRSEHEGPPLCSLLLRKGEPHRVDAQGPSVDEIARLQSIVEAVDGGAASLCSEGTLQLLCSFVHWPHSRLFPVLDALRLALVEPRNAAFLLSQPEAADSALAAVRANGLTLEAGEVNHMMALRLFCNLLASAPSNAVNETSLELLLPVLEAAAASEAYTASRRGTRIALSTMLLNASVLLAARKSNCERKTPFVCALQPFLTTPQPEIEVAHAVFSRFNPSWALFALPCADSTRGFAGALPCGASFGDALT